MNNIFMFFNIVDKNVCLLGCADTLEKSINLYLEWQIDDYDLEMGIADFVNSSYYKDVKYGCYVCEIPMNSISDKILSHFSLQYDKNIYNASHINEFITKKYKNKQQCKK